VSDSEVSKSYSNVGLCDFCILCGDAVGLEDWRNHMIGHSFVLAAPPKKNGEWLPEEEMVFVSR